MQYGIVGWQVKTDSKHITSIYNKKNVIQAQENLVNPFQQQSPLSPSAEYVSRIGGRVAAVRIEIHKCMYRYNQTVAESSGRKKNSNNQIHCDVIRLCNTQAHIFLIHKSLEAEGYLDGSTSSPQ